MTPDIDDMGPEEQDQSEVFDEDNYSLDGAGDASADMKTLEEIPDVYDVTTAVGDADDDAAAIGEELDDEEIAALEADVDLADFEDDELAPRMPEALTSDDGRADTPQEVRFAEESDLDDRARRSPRVGDHEVELVPAGDLDNVAAADASVLEAEALSDEAVAELGYDDHGDGDETEVRDGRPGQPVRFEITLRDKVWVLTRDGRPLHEYGHAERAVHEAAEMARELRRTGEPAAVYLEPKDGTWIEITDDEPPPSDAEAQMQDERAAVIPDRSPSA